MMSLVKQRCQSRHVFGNTRREKLDLFDGKNGSCCIIDAQKLCAAKKLCQDEYDYKESMCFFFFFFPPGSAHVYPLDRNRRTQPQPAFCQE